MILVFDFDSTLVRGEGLDQLFLHSLGGRPDRSERLAEFQRITDRGMAGEIPFRDSLHRRLELLEADRTMVGEVAEALAAELSSSVERRAAFFRRNAERIYVLSGGFRELIGPAAGVLGISADRIEANRFRFGPGGRVMGLDPDTLMARGGKPAALESWGLDPERVWVVGDGATDLELRALGLASRFIAFTENRRRPGVVEKADHVAGTMDDVVRLLNSAE